MNDLTNNAHLLSEDLVKFGLLKFELLNYGIKVTSRALNIVYRSKGIIRTRSGASGGLDLVLPHDIFVNVPLKESFVEKSPIILDYIDGQLCLIKGDEFLCHTELLKIPAYYRETAKNGVSMAKIGQMCSGDRFCYGMTGPYCWFWKSERRCKFCSIGLNKEQDASRKSVDRLLEVLEKAILDPVLPAKHILIGGGTPAGEDMGAILASEICYEIKRRFNISCYVMISAPLKNEYIKMLWEAGADELGMNLEFCSENAWEKYIPGKHEFIGKARYLEALEYAVSLFGPINTRSILIVGLEDPEITITGAEQLASMGVMPILSQFRPLTGTELQVEMGFDYLKNWEIYLEVLGRVAKYDIPVGPTCIHCQNNVLALPIPNGHYRYY